jgi:hypothetical protein
MSFHARVGGNRVAIVLSTALRYRYVAPQTFGKTLDALKDLQ